MSAHAAEPTSYVGRVIELAETRRLLERHRLVTLTGSGGVGKTRLAMRVLSEARTRFADGAVLVELARLRDPALVPTAVADALGLRALSGRPAPDLVVDHLRRRVLLLVLDNCEHLLDACADLVSAVLAACPGVAILTTSRQSLGVEGERILPVPPLMLPEAEDTASLAELTACESVRLLADRARTVSPSFEVTEENRADVVALTRRLDGLPLAIELAAARLRSLTPAQIVERLDRRLSLLTTGAQDAPRRQQTLRATIDWSHDLCTEAERLVWARSSVFSGSFELDAAEYVCAGDGVEEAEVLDLIDGLLDKSVLIREDHGSGVRYRMLETLREYGHERLGEDVEPVARRHRDWYRGVTERFGAEWLGTGQLAWLERLPRELANIWVALGFCVDTPGEAAVAVRMLDHIRPYWTVFGYMNETRRFVERALEVLSPDEREYRVGVWIDGFLAAVRGEAEPATRQLTAANEMATQAGDDALAAEVAFSGGVGLFLADYCTPAIPLLDNALTAYRALGFFEGELNALCFGGFARGFGGDVETAMELLGECVERSENAGEIYFRGWAMCALGYIHLEVDDLAETERFGKLALRFSASTGAWFIAAANTHLLAWTAAREERFDRAGTLFGAADVIWASIDLQARSFPIWAARLDRHESLTKQALGDAAFERNYARGRTMLLDEVVRYALDESPPAPVADRGGLTPREYEVAELVARGHTNQQIASALTIAKRTADAHIDHILTKLGLANRAQIAVWVAARGAG
ncbi:ATP-binding protein [Amycolatopsis sp. NPDC059027]|uniref:ATP-binding protein n=1 Tax=Amycolatopsis sp. NPDC059027 TaxID=3346709 RepID=UPI0036730D13